MSQDRRKSPSESPAGWRLWLPRMLTGILGLVILTAAVLKATDMELFVRQMRDYGILSDRTFLILSAWGVVTLECTIGVGLLAAYRPRFILSLTALLLITFIAATTSAWFRGSAADCGCFGAWLKHSPGEAAVLNLFLLALTLPAWIWPGRGKTPGTRIRASLTAAGCLVGLVLPVALGFPVMRMIQSVPERVGLDLGPLEVQGGDLIDLNYGEHLVIVMGTDCGHCQEAVFELNRLAEVPDLPRPVAVCRDDMAERMRFTEECQPFFPIVRISDDDFWRLLGEGDMPRIILVSEGRIVQVWDQTVPDESTIRASLKKIDS